MIPFWKNSQLTTFESHRLTSHFGMKPEDYTAVRVGMNATEAIIDGRVDAAIGLENVQMVSINHQAHTASYN